MLNTKQTSSASATASVDPKVERKREIDRMTDAILSILQSEDFDCWYSEGDFDKDIRGDYIDETEKAAIEQRVRDYVKRRFLKVGESIRPVKA